MHQLLCLKNSKCILWSQITKRQNYPDRIKVFDVCYVYNYFFLDKMSSDILNLLTSSSKLDRDNGLNIYQDFLTECTKNNTSVIDEVIQELEKRVKNAEVKWEEKHGYLLALKSLVAYKKTQNDDQFLQYCQTVGIQHLQDIEVRVRDAAGELMGELCLRHGVNIYRNNCDKVISLIRDNLERKMDSENEGTVQESVEVCVYNSPKNYIIAHSLFRYNIFHPSKKYLTSYLILDFQASNEMVSLNIYSYFILLSRYYTSPSILLSA